MTLPDAGFNSPKMSLTSVDLPCPFYGNDLITWKPLIKIEVTYRSYERAPSALLKGKADTLQQWFTRTAVSHGNILEMNRVPLGLQFGGLGYLDGNWRFALIDHDLQPSGDMISL